MLKCNVSILFSICWLNLNEHFLLIRLCFCVTALRNTRCTSSHNSLFQSVEHVWKRHIVQADKDENLNICPRNNFLIGCLCLSGGGAVPAADRHHQQHGELPVCSQYVHLSQFTEQLRQQSGRRLRRQQQWDGHDAGGRAHRHLQQLHHPPTHGKHFPSRSSCFRIHDTHRCLFVMPANVQWESLRIETELKLDYAPSSFKKNKFYEKCVVLCLCDLKVSPPPDRKSVV